MRLDDFPVELLATILNDHRSHLAITLWKCGSKLLNGKLQRGAVTSVDLVVKRFGNTSRWPRCLKEFKLERLSVRSTTHGLCSAKTLRNELKQLHGGLKELELCVSGALAAFFPLPPTSNTSALKYGSDDYAPRSKRAKTQETSDNDSTHYEPWNLDVTWPHMERLTIDSTVHPRNRLPPSILSLLPRSLTYLRMVTDFTHLITDFTTLPPHLKTLDLEFGAIGKKSLSLIPSTITNLGKSLNEEAQLVLFRDPSLLPNLEWFPIAEPKDGFYQLFSKVFSERLPWPSNIKALSFQECDVLDVFNETSPLPAQLQKFRFEAVEDDEDSELTAERLINLPKSLTDIYVHRVGWKNITSSMWPANMNDLFYCDSNPRWFHKTPRSLTSLGIGNAWWKHHGDEDSAELLYNREDDQSEGDSESTKKKKIASFTSSFAAGINTLATQDMPLWTTLKSALRGCDFASGDASAYCAAVESGQLCGLPLTLRGLQIDQYSHTLPKVLVLPPQLHSLRMELKRAFENWPTFFDLLPPSLTCLDLRGNLDPLQKCVKAWDAQTLDPQSTSLYKLKKLVYLQLSANDDGSLGFITKYLPRTLKTLILKTIEDEDIRELVEHLPTSLTALTLEIRAEAVSWVGALPKSLTSLNARQVVIQGEDVKNLPNLFSLSALFKDITIDHLLEIPRSLATLAMCRFRTAAPRGCLDEAQLLRIISAYQPYYTIFEASRADIDANLGEPEEDMEPESMRKSTRFGRLIAALYEDLTDTKIPPEAFEGIIAEEEEEEEEEDDGASESEDAEEEEEEDEEEEAAFASPTARMAKLRVDTYEDEEDDGASESEEEGGGRAQKRKIRLQDPKQTDIDPRTTRRLRG